MRWSPTGDDPRHMRISGTPRLRRHLRVHQAHRAARAQGQGRRRGDERHPQRHLRRRCSPRPATTGQTWSSGAATPCCCSSRAPTTPCGRPRSALPDAGDAAHASAASPRPRGRSTLRMSVGIHSGDFDFFLVGDPAIHRELLISGPGASVTADMEAAASAGQIGLSPTTAALLPPRLLGRAPGWTAGCCARSRCSTTSCVLPSPDVDRHRPGRTCCPPPIRAHLLAGTGEPEHRTIAVAFVQFSGTDALLDPRGAGRARRGARRRRAQRAGRLRRPRRHVLRDRHQPRRRQDHAHGGGAAQRRPRRGADAAGRAARPRPGRGACRCGSGSTGVAVFSGDFGPAFRRTYSVKGDAINLAARVMGKASPGQALATLEVVERVARPCSAPPSCRRSWSRASRAGPSGRRRRPRRCRATRSGCDVPLVGSGRRRWPCCGRRSTTSRASTRPPRRGRRRARDRQVAPGRGAARPAIDDVPVVRAPVRGVRVVDGLLPVPPAAARGAGGSRRTPAPTHVADRLKDRGRRALDGPGRLAAPARHRRWTCTCRRPRRPPSSTSSSARPGSRRSSPSSCPGCCPPRRSSSSRTRT